MGEKVMAGATEGEMAGVTEDKRAMAGAIERWQKRQRVREKW